MSSRYSANQYDSAFKSQKLQNWTVPKQCNERPSAVEGLTSFIATDRGHLLPEVKSKRGSAWTSFKGTWDLPARIPLEYMNTTGRSLQGQQRLQSWGLDKPLARSAPARLQEAEEKQCGSTARSTRAPGEEQTETDQPMEASATPAQHIDKPAVERPESQQSQAQSRPASQQSQAQSRPASQQSQAKSRPVSQQGQAQSRPASRQSQAKSRPVSQQSQAKSRPVSQQGQAQSRPASQQSQAQSRPVSQQSQAQSRPASQQNGGQSLHPPTQETPAP